MDIRNDNTKSSEYFCKGLEFQMNIFTKKGLVIKDEVILLVGTTSIESQDWIKSQLREISKVHDGDFNNMIVVIVDYFKDSMIHKKYISNRMLKGIKVNNNPKIICIDFTETDHILSIEDEYNNTFSYRLLSRYYKRQLRQICHTLKDEQSKDIKKKAESKRRGRYADSGLV